MNYDLDDAKLTAYALDELDASERAAIEAWLAENEAGRQAVAEIRAAADLLTRELAAEPSIGLADQNHRMIQQQLSARRMSIQPQTASGRKSGRTARRLIWAAAASVAIAGGTAALLMPSLNRARETAPAIYARMEKSTPSQAPPKVETKFSDKLPINPGYLSSSSIGEDSRGSKRNSKPSEEFAVATDAEQVGQGRTFQSAQRAYREPEDKDRMVADARTVPTRANKNEEESQTSALRSPKPLAQTDVVLSQTERDNRFLPPIEKGKYSALPEKQDKEFNTESYDRIVDNSFLQAGQNPLSTFSIDVDTASYANMRRFLNQNQLPPPDAVRIEEMINYFPYSYEPPKDAEAPFSSQIEIAQCPWNSEHQLARIALKGKEIKQENRPPSNLVFLIDVSGSMTDQNKLPLLKQSMAKLVEQLTENDRVAMVVYAGSSGLALPSTSCDRKETILAALQNLQPGGSTNGAAGIELAYQTAASGFIQGGVNRVILCTDGDFNVGVTNQGELTRLIEDKAKSGVFLSVLGFGMGNVKDSTMEKLADKGNGNYAYIDTLKEGQKVLVEQMAGTLITIAKDVKIQIEFNPAKVGAYRLIGYENRILAKEDFNDDKKDAGEIGAGHTVTALYEIIPAGKKVELSAVDPLKYQPMPEPAARPGSDELLTLKLRYKEPEGQTSKLLEFPVKDSEKSYAQATEDFKFAAAVASFGMILRQSPHKGAATFDSVLELAEEARGQDKAGYRGEFLDLVRKAKSLYGS